MKVIHARHTGKRIELMSVCPFMNLFCIVFENDRHQVTDDNREMDVWGHTLIVYRSTTLASVASQHFFSFHGKGDKPQGQLLSCWSPTGRFLCVAMPDGVVHIVDVELGRQVRLFMPCSHLFLHVLGRKGVDIPPSTHTGTSFYGVQFEEEVRQFVSGRRGVGGGTDEKCSVPVLLMEAASAPLRALTWTSVREERQYGVDSFTVTPEKACLPLPLDVSTSLLDELQIVENGEQRISLLTILTGDGKVLLMAGGLIQVYCVNLSFPASLSGRPEWGHLTVCKSKVVDKVGEPTPQNLLRRLGCTATLDHTNATYEGYVTLREVENETPTHPCLYSFSLPYDDKAAALRETISAQTVFSTKVMEYLMLSKHYFTLARNNWANDFMANRVKKHLFLPEKGNALRNSLVETMFTPHMTDYNAYTDEMEAYFKSIKTDVVEEDADVLSATMNDTQLYIENYCYRYLDVCLHLVGQLARGADVGPQRGGDAFLKVLEDVAALKNNCEEFLFNTKVQCQQVRLLLCYVLQKCAVLVGTDGNQQDNPPQLEGNAPAQSENAEGTADKRTINMLIPISDHPQLIKAIQSLASASDAGRVPGDAYGTVHARLLSHLHTTYSGKCVSTVCGPVNAVYPFPHCTNVACGVETTSGSAGGAHEEHSRDRVTLAYNNTGGLSLWSAPLPLSESDTMRFEPQFSVSMESLLNECGCTTGKTGDLTKLLHLLTICDDRHLLLVSATSSSEGANRALILACVDNEGNLRYTEADDDEEDAADPRTPEVSVIPLENTDGKDFSERHVSIGLSREREFCVISTGSNYVVVDLYEM